MEIPADIFKNLYRIVIGVNFTMLTLIKILFTKVKKKSLFTGYKSINPIQI